MNNLDRIFTKDPVAFAEAYLDYLTSVLKTIDAREIGQFIETLLDARESDATIYFIGNGGSAAIASHVSVDLTKNANIRSVNFNEADLITCFSNDYGYEHWIEMAINYFGDKNDVLIVISSSGKSKNIINACTAAKKKKFSKIITLTGHSIKNPIKKLGNINLWVNSKAYNKIENIHQFWLLSLVDLIVGKANYLTK